MSTTKRIAVAGGTGRVGRPLVAELTARGHDAVALARATGVDVSTGAGLEEALAGVEVVVDALGAPSTEQVEVAAFFATTAGHLHDAARRAGVRRMVVVSVIGADRFTAGYPAAKLAHERSMQTGPVSVDVVRIAQLHEFVEQVVAWGRDGEVTRVREMRANLVAARTVAEALADVADGSVAAADLHEVAGPRPESIVDAARLLVSRRDLPLKVERVSDPVNAARYEGGALLPGPGARLGGPTFEEWLDASRSEVARIL
jgi:uncharacterized protein YbjT (DUF2867 family)